MSENFSLEELVSSSTAKKLNIDNSPCDVILENLREAVVYLEHIRASLGGFPIIINSGFRCHALNTAVGGSRSSSHLDGQAFDIVIKNGRSPHSNALRIKNMLIDYDQIISYKTFTHIGFGPKKRRQFIIKPQ